MKRSQFLSVSIRRRKRTNQEHFTRGRQLKIVHFPFSLQISLWATLSKHWFQSLFLGLCMSRPMESLVFLSLRKGSLRALILVVCLNMCHGEWRKRQSRGIREASLIFVGHISQAHYGLEPLHPVAKRCWPGLCTQLSSPLISLPVYYCWHLMYIFYSFFQCKHT